jgi:YtcA family
LKPRTNFLIQSFFTATIRTLLILVAVSTLESCSSPHQQVPSLDVFGSYFPAWLISLVAGIVLTVIAVTVAGLIDIKVPGLLGFLVRVSLILIFSISVWFLFFAR